MVERLLDQYACLEIALLPGRYIDDLARARIPCRRLWFGIFDPQYAKTTNLDPVALDQTLAHGPEKGINNLVGELLLDAQFLRNPEGEVLFGRGHTILRLGGSQKDGG